MRLAQYRILTRILDKVDVPEYIHGFETGRSIPKMAQLHTGKQVVISVDIKDFFPSILQYMVKTLFANLGYDDKASTVLSELCTYKAYVPQGSLTAPKVSNLITAGTFGPELKTYCDKEGLDLTIYADDITISFNDKSQDRQVNKQYCRDLIDLIKATVKKYGFTVNGEKTKVMRPFQRQWVCGAVVNVQVNMRKTERLALKALVHNCSRNGIEAEASKTGMNPENFIRKYAGRINWLCQLNMDSGAKLKTEFRKITVPYLRKFPEIQIPELSWNSGIEIPYEREAGDETFLSTETQSTSLQEASII
jgi:retron-type reverse transcriptase